MLERTVRGSEEARRQLLPQASPNPAEPRALSDDRTLNAEARTPGSSERVRSQIRKGSVPGFGFLIYTGLFSKLPKFVGELTLKNVGRKCRAQTMMRPENGFGYFTEAKSGIGSSASHRSSLPLLSDRTMR